MDLLTANRSNASWLVRITRAAVADCWSAFNPIRHNALLHAVVPRLRAEEGDDTWRWAGRGGAAPRCFTCLRECFAAS
jgi:hypothetical protein